jgi:ATP-binding cassette subfamily C protein LapB
METKIKNNLAKNIVSKTVLLITHKNTILSLVERLIILDNGKVVIDGKRDDVLRKLGAPTKVVKKSNEK